MKNIVAVRHEGCKKNYLFEVPAGVSLEKGRRVLCETKNGVVEAECAIDSMWVDENVLEGIAVLTNATLPLKPVIGLFRAVFFPVRAMGVFS